MRPMSFVFPADQNVIPDGHDETQFLLGEAYLVKPTDTEALDKIDIYLPEGIWYDAFTMQKHEGKQEKV